MADDQSGKRPIATIQRCECVTREPAEEIYHCQKCGRFSLDGKSYASIDWLFGLTAADNLIREAESIIGTDENDDDDYVECDVSDEVLEWAWNVIGLADSCTNLDPASAWQLASRLSTWTEAGREAGDPCEYTVIADALDAFWPLYATLHRRHPSAAQITYFNDDEKFIPFRTRADLMRGAGRSIRVVGDVQSTFRTSELLSELGDIGPASLGKYVRLALVRTTRKGERDRRWTEDERYKILRAFAEHAPNTTAKLARQILVQIELKSKDRN